MNPLTLIITGEDNEHALAALFDSGKHKTNKSLCANCVVTQALRRQTQDARWLTGYFFASLEITAEQIDPIYHIPAQLRERMASFDSDGMQFTGTFELTPCLSE